MHQAGSVSVTSMPHAKLDLLAIVVGALLALPSAASARTRTCADFDGVAYSVRDLIVTNITCGKGRTVIRAWVRDGHSHQGFSCHLSSINRFRGTARVHCSASRGRRLRFNYGYG